MARTDEAILILWESKEKAIRVSFLPFLCAAQRLAPTWMMTAFNRHDFFPRRRLGHGARPSRSFESPMDCGTPK
jgi:hypothetical protein